MALYKRNNLWWFHFTFRGRRIRKSSGTSDKKTAQQLHDKIKAELWNAEHLNQKPKTVWREAVKRWIYESQHKRSLVDDKMHLRWLDPHLRNVVLQDITRDFIDNLAKLKEDTGVKPSTVNRMLALIRSILRKSEREWGWLDKAPAIRMRPESKGRIRWLTPEEVNRLLKILPPHLADMTAFTLATGLRRANVTGLQWCDVDLIKRHALVHPDQAKTKKAIPVPLNTDAITILKKQLGKHVQFVFTFRGRPITQCNTKAWKKALKKSGITNFKWHDLRHTWASWHVQNGTTLQELQQLGGWASFDMVLRYAHLSSDHLREAAERICDTNLTHAPLMSVTQNYANA